MTKGSIGMALFTGAFVGIAMFFIEYLISDSSLFVKVIIAGLSALVGGLIGSKLFQVKQIVNNNFRRQSGAVRQVLL